MSIKERWLTDNFTLNKKRPKKKTVVKKAVTETIKRSRGPKEMRAMFAKMGASGSLQGKGPSGKRTGDKLPPTGDPELAENPSDEEIVDWLNALPDFSGGVERDILPPPGRAPTGQGKEWQVRRWINKKIETLETRKQNLEKNIARDRGTKRSRQLASRSRIVLDAINQSLQVSRHVIQNIQDAGMDFADSRSLFSSLFEIPTALAGGI